MWVLSVDGAFAASCGDEVVVAPETCDDGNVNSGDGCYESCVLEDTIELFGTAQGGTVQIVVNGVASLIATSAGQSADTIASNLSAFLNITPRWRRLGFRVSRSVRNS